MQVTAEHPDPCTVVLDINVDEQRVARAFETSYTEFSRFASVPGFRPGKAPLAIVKRYLNMERVRQATLERLIRETYFEAMESESLTPYRDPQIEPTDLVEGQSYSYRAIVPLEPQITLGEYTGLTVEKPIYKVSDEVVEERLTKLREERARLERVTDRGVEPGDILIVEQQVHVEGEEAPSGPGRRQLVQLGDTVPGYDDALIGTAIGEERTFEIVYPDDYSEEERRGKKATYTVKLSSISAKKMPALDDEFAKAVQGGETVEELRASVRKSLQDELDQYSNQVAEQRLFSLILEGSTIYFPQVLIREEVEDELRRLSQQLRTNNVSYAQYLESIGAESPEQHQNNLAQRAFMQIRTLLALREISIQEGLQATGEEVEAEFSNLLANEIITEEQYEEFRVDDRRRLQMANAMIQHRLQAYLFANNTINEVEQAHLPSEEEVEEIEEELLGLEEGELEEDEDEDEGDVIEAEFTEVDEVIEVTSEESATEPAAEAPGEHAE